MKTDDIFYDKDADLSKLSGKTVAIHGYHMFAPETPEAMEGTSRLAAFLNEKLAG